MSSSFRPNTKSRRRRPRWKFRPRRRLRNSSATNASTLARTDMFYAIHRAIKFALFCCVLWVGWKAYQHRQVAEPALIWYDVWDNGGFREQPMPTMDGRVEKVLGSQTFVLKGTNVTRYNVRLMGLRDPSRETTLDVLEKERKRAE